MRFDEVAEAQRLIKQLQPCPYCGAIKPDTDMPMIHTPECPLPAELAKLGAQEIS